MTDWSPPPSAPPGSDFARYLRDKWPQHLAVLRAEKAAARAPEGAPRPDVPSDGECAECGATPTVNRTRLCGEHYRAAIDRVRDELAGRKTTTTDRTKTTGPPPPKSRKIDPSDVFNAGDRVRVPADERARHAARWLAGVGEPVTRADFLRVAGIGVATGAGRGVLAVAVERGWIRRGPGGSVVPGGSPPD